MNLSKGKKIRKQHGRSQEKTWGVDEEAYVNRMASSHSKSTKSSGDFINWCAFQCTLLYPGNNIRA